MNATRMRCFTNAVDNCTAFTGHGGKRNIYSPYKEIKRNNAIIIVEESDHSAAKIAGLFQQT